MYCRVCVDLYVVVVNSCIFFLRFRREEGKIVENDDEYGVRCWFFCWRKMKLIICYLMLLDESGWLYWFIEIYKYGIVD